MLMVGFISSVVWSAAEGLLLSGALTSPDKMNSDTLVNTNIADDFLTVLLSDA